MNASRKTFCCDPEVLADLLKVGMIDSFVTEFKRAASRIEVQENLPELITQINDCLDAQNVSKKRLKSRLEYSECTDFSAQRVDVVTPCTFVGAGWPSRRTILLQNPLAS